MAAREDKLFTIDTHHHMLPDFFWRETENAHGPVGGLAPLRWSPEVTVSFMDDAAIDVAVVSLSTPGVHTGNSVKARRLARRCNEFAAELVRRQPHRFASLACLPLPDIDASLEELAYAFDVLELDGVVLFTNANSVYLGDVVLEPVFEELERRQAIVFVQPNPSPDAAAHSLGLPDNLLHFPTDTNRAVAQMQYTNRFARTPNVKYTSLMPRVEPLSCRTLRDHRRDGLHPGWRAARQRRRNVPQNVLGHCPCGERSGAPHAA
jgi:predicted TIM-barrel fold metal-dependent hydrolase